jgi:uncharacterized protein (TIGR03083 family)
MLPSLDALGEGLGAAATVLRANAMATPLDAPVPTCPGWSLRDLVVHQGMVHRWAASHLRGTPEGDPDSLARSGAAATDLLGWFDEGANELLQAIVDAPDDLGGTPFLLDAPAPRLFWARRQCHETTMHAVDALAARLGRAPTAEETWISPVIALDGIDELLTGFVPRRRPGVNRAATRMLVAPLSTTRAWLLDVAPDRPPLVERLDLDPGGVVPSHDAALTGEPVEVYLRLWSRGGVPRDELEQWWADAVSVTW